MPQDFAFPFFYSYPPYFTLQPVKDTRSKQSALWQELILRYCRTQKVFLLTVDAADDLPLFYNKELDRRLSREARTAFLSDLAATGHALWLDKDRRQCLVLWKTLEQWADTLHGWAADNGLQGSVLALAELSAGDEVAGTELEGLPPRLVSEALRVLEARGQARVFQGEADGSQGVKFV